MARPRTVAGGPEESYYEDHERGLDSGRLSKKQERFISEYLIDANASRAGMRAGCKSPSAGFLMMQNPLVKKEIESIRQSVFRGNKLLLYKIIRELGLVGFSRITDFVIDKNGTLDIKPGSQPEAINAVVGYTYRKTTDKEGATTETITVRLHDKLRALELIGKHLGMFDDRLEIVGNSERPVVVDVKELTRDQLNAIASGAYNRYLESKENKEGVVENNGS